MIWNTHISNILQVLFKIGALKNFAKLTKKPVLDSLFNKVVELSPATRLKETPAQLFFSEFCEMFENAF